MTAERLLSTISEAIRLAAKNFVLAGIPDEDAHLEARLLYQHAAGVSAEQLIADLREPADSTSLAEFESLADQRRNRQPLAYIVGEKEFYGRKFNVDERCLIPRPETELVVEMALNTVLQWGISKPRICDIGTGSGVLAITLALEITDSLIVATDVSSASLELAESNARNLGVSPDRISFERDDIIEPHSPNLLNPFDLIVSNPPYVTTPHLAKLEPEVRDWEPTVALDGGENGMKVLKPLIALLPLLLKAGQHSAAFIEIDPPVAEPCEAAARKAFPHANISISNDLASLERVLSIIT